MDAFKPQLSYGVPVPYNASIASLRDEAATPGSRAWAAILALGYKTEPEALTILVELTRSPDWRFRRCAVEAIGLNPSGQIDSEVIGALLHDKVAYVVRSAVKAAARLGLKGTHKEVLSLTGASDPSTRVEALLALESLWEPSDFGEVLERYSGDRSETVRKQAAWTIRKNVDERHWRQVFSEWSKDPVRRHRVWACELAERFGTNEVLPALGKLLGDSDGHVRKAANRAIAATEHRSESQES